MEHGVLRISETSEGELEPSRAFIIIVVSSNKLVFGNAAVTASEEVNSIVTKVQKVSSSVEIETESVTIQSESGLWGKNSRAAYTLKLTVRDLDSIGDILGICSDEKNTRVRSIQWDYEEEELKLQLAKEAIKKAKTKAEQMMETINYSVVGIRSCSDSFVTPNIGEIILSQPREGGVESRALVSHAAPSPAINFGAQFTRKRRLSATCTVEFLIKEKT